MRGGKRDGAGRKPAEKTVRMSIPLNLVPHIQAFIEAYKQEELNFDQVIKKASELNKRHKIKNKSNNTSVDDQFEADKLANEYDKPDIELDAQTEADLIDCQIINDKESTEQALNLNQEIQTDLCQVREILNAEVKPESSMDDNGESQNDQINDKPFEYLPLEERLAKMESDGLIPDHKGRMKTLERISDSNKKLLKKNFGTLFEAARQGIYAEGKQLIIQHETRASMDIPSNSRKQLVRVDDEPDTYFADWD